jgi:hypothetical protein
MQELTQKNGKNWRRFKIEGKKIIVETMAHGNTSQVSRKLSELGYPTGDYDFQKELEQRKDGRTFYTVAIIGFVLSALFVYAGSKDNPKYPSNGLDLLITLLAVGFFIALIVYPAINLRSTRFKSVYFKADFKLNFYCRNQKDEDQIDAFLKEIAAAQNDIYKQEFEEYFNNSPLGLRTALTDLNEHGVFSDEEYRHYLAAINEAEEKNTPEA